MNKKFLKVVLAAFTVFFVANTNTVVSAAETDVVNIPDAGLRACLNSYFVDANTGEPIDPASDLTEGELAEFVGTSAAPIDCNGYNISNLEGVQYLVNVEYLDLTSNNITNVSALSSLTQLKSLGLSRNSIMNVDTLGSLTNLNKLTLRENHITDISALSGLTQLRYLSLSDNTISDISPLSGLTNLVSLHLEANAITDISPLQGLTNLSAVNVSRQYISAYDLYSYTENYQLPDVIDNSGNVVEYIIDNNYTLVKDTPTDVMNSWNHEVALGSGNVFFSGEIYHTVTWGEMPVNPETPEETPVTEGTLPETGFNQAATASLLALLGLAVSKKLFVK